MASDLRGYSADEVLNKVLNTSNDSIQVDIVAGAEYAEDSGHTTEDTGQFVLGVRNDTLGTLGGTNGDYVPFQMNASGALYVEVASSSVDDSIFVDNAGFTLTTSKVNVAGGVYQSSTPGTLNDNDAGAILLNSTAGQMVELMASSAAIGSVSVSNLLADGHAVTIDNLASNEVYVRGSGTAGTADAGVVTVQGIASGTAQPVSGTFWQTTQPVSGTVTANAGSGTLAVSLAAAIEVVGDVAEDAAVSGFPVLTGGRYDATQRTLDDGDVGALALDPSGALYTREYTGQDGAVYTTASSDVIVPPDGKAFVAIQMLEDTTFDSSGGLIAVTATRWFNTEDAAGDLGSGSESTAEGSGGKQISNSVTFPQGMTIFGRWSGIDINAGSVIAYIGDY